MRVAVHAHTEQVAADVAARSPAAHMLRRAKEWAAATITDEWIETVLSEYLNIQKARLCRSRVVDVRSFRGSRPSLSSGHAALDSTNVVDQ